MDSDKLREHIYSNYTAQRFGVALIGFVFPLLLVAGGKVHGIPFQDSMSAYYHATDGSPTGEPVMRNWFVGILFAVGVFLYVYKGFTQVENWVLNLAGFLALGVAIFPEEQGQGGRLTAHGVCAVSFFLCIAFVCIACAPHTLHYLKDPKRERRYRYYYYLTGAGMILSPLGALILALGLQQLKAYTFYIEAVGIWVFAAYWLIKTLELRSSKAERNALFTSHET